MTQGVRKKDGKTGRGYPINSHIHGKMFDWTCPKCNLRNINCFWLGRRFYSCERCGSQSDVKGQTIGMNKTISMINIL